MQKSRTNSETLPTWMSASALVIFAWLAWSITSALYGHGDDRAYFTAWATHIKIAGLRQAYGSGTDYPPLFQYILWAYAKLCPDVEAVVRNMPRLRLVTLAFDVAGIALVARWAGRRGWWPILALAFVLNLAASYNTLVWGQVDGILATLVFAALYTVGRSRLVISSILMALALCFKLQAIVFVPVWGLGMLHAAAVERRWRRLAVGLATGALTIAITCAPFLLTPASRAGLSAAFFGSVDRYPYCSFIAGNIWYWIVDTNPRWTADSTILIGGMSCKQVGLLLFFVASAAALIPLMRTTCRAVVKPENAIPIQPTLLWLTASLVLLLFFFCNTQMHERYSHPALIFLTAYALSTRDLTPYAIFCIAYFLNLEKSNEWLVRHYDWVVFDGRFIAGMFALLIVYLFARLYGFDRKKMHR